ncbi:MAG: FAD-binding protein [Pseudobacteriovorax sp.]|nr:FAD-binding protein [Pseudobacteriovorax sp.]
MNVVDTDIMIIGAGPVGLMCALLAHISSVDAVVIDKSHGPLEVGRADALNARTLQLFEIVGLFDELYPLGKPCNTSSVFKEGKFISRQSSWWDELEGCFHKHFLMLGQSHIEKLIDEKLKRLGAAVVRGTTATDIQVLEDHCLTTLSNGQMVKSRYVIGADGSRSYVRRRFNIPFSIVRPQIVWAVIDGVIESDFPKVPEIIVFQADTSDVAWIPREGDIDRFYVRMDQKEFALEDCLGKINRAMQPYRLEFKTIAWFSQFSVKESVAASYSVDDKVFLAGDSCHIHSVNGGQGLNTGLADAFNLMWKLNMSLKQGHATQLLASYETERLPVAKSVIESSGALVRATKDGKETTHAENYVRIVKEKAGNITGMGIRYSRDDQLVGSRLHDFEITEDDAIKRIYSILNYSCYSLLIFSDEDKPTINVPEFVRVICVGGKDSDKSFKAKDPPYKNVALLVRPDAYIHEVLDLDQLGCIENCAL